MEMGRYKARLDLLDAMLARMNASAKRVQHIRRTVFVLRVLLNREAAIPSVYGPDLSITRFSLQ